MNTVGHDDPPKRRHPIVGCLALIVAVPIVLLLAIHLQQRFVILSRTPKSVHLTVRDSADAPLSGVEVVTREATRFYLVPLPFVSPTWYSGPPPRVSVTDPSGQVSIPLRHELLKLEAVRRPDRRDAKMSYLRTKPPAPGAAFQSGRLTVLYGISHTESDPLRTDYDIRLSP